MKFIYFTFLISLAIGCGAGSSKSSKKKKNKSKSYTYDEASRSCKRDGVQGFNIGEIGPCGYVENVSLVDEDLSGRDLRGMAMVGVDLTGANLSGADMLGGQLKDVKLNSADLSDAVMVAYFEKVEIRKSNLRGTIFARLRVDETTLVASFNSVDFDGSTIDGGTLMAKTLEEATGRMGMEYVSAERAIPLGNVGGHNFRIEFNHRGHGAIDQVEEARVRNDIDTLASMQLGSGDSEWFEKLFGEDGMQGVLNFLDKRVHYVLSDTDSRDSGSKNTLAANYGPTFWNKMYNDRSLGTTRTIPKFEINGQQVPLDSPRTGVISIGKQYVNMLIPQMRRLGTLVHEARHSDCPSSALPSDSELRAFVSGERSKVSKCNYVHAKCPAGHDLEGQAACDGVAWGAYGVAAMFLERVSESCENCSEEEKQLALVAEMDTKSRVLVLEKMLAGELGDPDLSSVE